MIIWKNTCGESWQRTIENGWEVSGKPGAFLFFIPKGALTHHLLKQAVVALPLVGHVRSSPGQEPPAAVALRNAPAGAVRGGLRLLREPLDNATLLRKRCHCPHKRQLFRHRKQHAVCLRKPATGSFSRWWTAAPSTFSFAKENQKKIRR